MNESLIALRDFLALGKQVLTAPILLTLTPQLMNDLHLAVVCPEAPDVCYAVSTTAFNRLLTTSAFKNEFIKSVLQDSSGYMGSSHGSMVISDLYSLDIERFIQRDQLIAFSSRDGVLHSAAVVYIR